ncbi:MAG TPA: TRAP transporter substrate-binding protein DctP [Dactylosporangium sp.]|jgi:TRAP-type C4-dicarboxylate transport system substrate-binding protein|nr:TRAP transporter substrate-binding protein DctP [Dactylosporangium sp.]
MMISPRYLKIVPFAIAAAALTAACTSGSGDPGGVGRSSVVLTMANGSANIASYPAVAQFVNRFTELESGLSANVVDRWGDFKPDSEQQIVRDVASGKADVGWVGARVFDTLGVSSLQALSAPMLVDSYALQQAVVDSDVSRRMLDGVDKVGVHGLGLLAGGLRKPVSVKRPFLRAADWQGARFGTLKSATQTTAIEALGAKPTEVLAQDRDKAIDSGQLDAFEMSLRGYQFNSLERRAPYVAANVNLWPEMMVLIVNPDRFGKLRDYERARLVQAANETAARSGELSGGDAALLAQECQLGARAHVAAADDLAALRDAFAPVYAKLRQDAATRDVIARIEELKRSTTAEPALTIPAGCTETDPAPVASNASNELLGTWEAASPHPYLFEVTDSVWVQYERRTDGSTEQGWRGTYTISGSTVRLKEIGAGCELEYQFTLQAGELRIKVVRSGPEDNPDCGPHDLAVQRFIYETAPFHKTK